MSNLLKSLEQVHSSLNRQWGDAQQDIMYAQQLEQFFNYIFGYTQQIQNVNGIEEEVEKFLNQEAAEKIRETIKMPKGKMPEWEKLEKNIAKIVEAMIQQSNFADKAVYRGKGVLGGRKGAQVLQGRSTSTVNTNNIPKSIRDEVMKSLKENNNKITTKGYYYKKQGKNDTVLITAELDISEIDGGNLFNNLSFTIKNYSGELMLEQVNLDKAYLAMLNATGRYRNISAYEYFLQRGKKFSDNIQQHLNHFRNIYALTGLGSEYLRVGNDGNIQIFSRFLVFRQSSKKIRVVSTKELVNRALNNEMGLFKTGTVDRGKYQIADVTTINTKLI